MIQDAALLGGLILAPLVGLLPVLLFRFTGDDEEEDRDRDDTGRVRCPHCGEVNDASYRLCRNCGTAIGHKHRSAFTDR